MKKSWKFGLLTTVAMENVQNHMKSFEDCFLNMAATMLSNFK